MATKTDLRRALRKIRQDFVLEHKFSFGASHPSADKILKLISGVKSLACYHDVIGEPDISAFAHFAERHGVTTALPWLSPDLDKAEARQARLIFRTWAPCDPLVETALGFRQPVETAKAVAPELILTPLLGFDRKLNRLGQGAGHYDRAFADYPNAVRIGVAWSVQEIESVPVDPWDVSLDAILTEQELLVAPGGRV